MVKNGYRLNPEHRTDNTTMDTEQMQVKFVSYDLITVFRKIVLFFARLTVLETNYRTDADRKATMKKALNKNWSSIERDC